MAVFFFNLKVDCNYGIYDHFMSWEYITLLESNNAVSTISYTVRDSRIILPHQTSVLIMNRIPWLSRSTLTHNKQWRPFCDRWLAFTLQWRRFKPMSALIVTWRYRRFRAERNFLKRKASPKWYYHPHPRRCSAGSEASGCEMKSNLSEWSDSRQGGGGGGGGGGEGGPKKNVDTPLG